MTDQQQLTQIVAQLKSSSLSYAEAAALLSKAKLRLLRLNALTTTSTTNPALLNLARETYEQGALHSIRARDPQAFTRYVQQLTLYYELESFSSSSSSSSFSSRSSEQSKITGLYLLLLLTQGRYAEFHTELETLSTSRGADLEGDLFLRYPVRLERWLMEGSYDRVWNALKRGEEPCPEYSLFSDILVSQMRSEIASSSERAYPSLPLSSTKSLLFLDSEGAVIEFAHQRGWKIADGHIIFSTDGVAPEDDSSTTMINNTLGYARELETIV